MKFFIFVTLIIQTALCQVFAGNTNNFSCKITSKDIIIECGTLGELMLFPPRLFDGKKRYKPTICDLNKSGAKLKFPNGTTGQITLIKCKSVIKLTLDRVPANIKSVQLPLIMPMSLAAGGKWRIGRNGVLTAFPAKRSSKPILGGKISDNFYFEDSKGNRFEGNIVSPLPDYIHFQDNRFYNWPRFQFLLVSNLKQADKPTEIAYHFKLTSSGNKKPIVDCFGQPLKKNYPEKIKNESELKEDLKHDTIYYSKLNPPARDKFGGMPQSRDKLGLHKTGFFHVERISDGRLVMVDPEGNLFFQLGVCSVKPYAHTYIRGRPGIYSWLPETKGVFSKAYKGPDSFSFYVANLIRKFGQTMPEDFEKVMVYRLRKLGFNSYGAFSAYNRGMPYTPMLPGFWNLKPFVDRFFDPFDPANVKKLDNLFKETVAPLADDPMLIGYFLANEQHFDNIAPQLAAKRSKAPAKIKLAEFLKKRYHTIAAFNQSWRTDLKTFKDIPDTSLVAESKAAAKDMHDFVRIFLKEYFRLYRSTFKKYDKNHLLIGSRFLPAMSGSVDYVGINAEYVDIFSINYYTYQIEKDFLRKVNKLAHGKPIILSEWSFGTAEQGLSGGVRDTTSQHERGLAYRNYVEQAANLHFIVGCQWFSLVDQPITGRAIEKYNGECMNIGLFNVADRPYKKFIAEVIKTNYSIYPLLLDKKTPYKYSANKFNGSKKGSKTIQIPRARTGITVDGTFKGWPGRPAERISSENLVAGMKKSDTGADFWLCWDYKKLYLYMIVSDQTPGRNSYTGKDIWRSDAIELFIGTKNQDKGGPLIFSDRQIIIGANPEINNQYHCYNTAAKITIKYKVIIHPDNKGYTVEASIPLDMLGIKPESGTVFKFDIGLDESDGGRKRQRQFMWNGSGRNSSERSKWGLAKLVD